MPTKKVMKTCVKKAMKKQKASFTHLTASEKDCLSRLQDEGKSPSQVAELLGRDLSSVNRHFQRNSNPPKKAPKSVGRPAALTEKQIDRVVDTTERMIQAAGKSRKPYQVTASMVRTALKFKCRDRVILEGLHKRGVTSHKMREKPARTEEDVQVRWDFGKKYYSKPDAFWEGRSDGPQAYLDNKFFSAYLTQQGDSC